MIQARLSENDSRLYSTNRDVAHNFPWVIEEVFARCQAGNWQELHALVRSRGVDDAELGAVCEALGRFMAIEAENPKEGMGQGLARSGFLARPFEARVLVMAYLGTVVLGMHWAGVREATLGGVGPALTQQDLRWRGRRCALLMRMPRWRRWLYSAGRRWRRAWRALRGNR